jgi:hypothetical protein
LYGSATNNPSGIVLYCLGITSEQVTAGRCKWCQKLLQREMLTRTWLGSQGRGLYGATGARFRVWLRFLAISDLVAVDWLRLVGSTLLQSFVKPIRDRAESVELHFGEATNGNAAWQV